MCLLGLGAGIIMASWHYVVGQDRFGPVSDDEIRELIRSGRINRETLVWQPGFDGWRTASEVLSSILDEVPPPLPSPPPVPSSVRLGKDSASSSPPMPSRTEDICPSPTYHLARPWPRFWARLIDVWFFTPVLGFAIAFAAAFYAPGFYVKLVTTNAFVLGLILLPLVCVVLAVLMALMGTTPGKAILGISVRPTSGRTSLGSFLNREMNVWIYGLACGIPIITLFTYIHQYRRVTDGKPAGYDEGLFTVESASSRFRVWIGALSAILLIMALSVLNGIDMSAERDVETTRSWLNPVTSRAAEIAKTWNTSELQTNSGRVFYFSSSTLVAEALLGYEQIAATVDLNSYALAIKDVLSSEMRLTSEWMNTTVNGRPALKAMGTSLKQADTYIEIIVTLNGRDAWRTLVFSVGRRPDDLPGKNRFIHALFKSAF